MSVEHVENGLEEGVLDDAILEAMAPLDGGDLDGALAALEALIAEHGEQPVLIEALADLGDWEPLREPRPEGIVLIERLIGWSKTVAAPRNRVTLLMAIAELETTQRQPDWAAHWIKRAIAADHSDLRPWDALELLMDAFPGLPVDKRTLDHLTEIRTAIGGRSTLD